MHLHLYVGEFSGHHSARYLDTDAQMERLARGMEMKRLRYHTLIGKVPSLSGMLTTSLRLGQMYEIT